MISDFLANVNSKRLVPTVLAVFAFVVLSDWIAHGVLLGPAYRATAELWRPQSEMGGHMLWMLLGQFLVAKFFCVIFAKGYEGKGLMEGVRYGLIIWPFVAGPYFIQYAVMPLPASILWSWVIIALVQTVLGGVIAAAVYRRA